jgi:hypothetical protein
MRLLHHDGKGLLATCIRKWKLESALPQFEFDIRGWQLFFIRSTISEILSNDG